MVAVPGGGHPGVLLPVFQTVGFGDDSFTVQGKTTVHFGGAHRDDDDGIAVSVMLNFSVQHFAKVTGTHFHKIPPILDERRAARQKRAAAWAF